MLYHLKALLVVLRILNIFQNFLYVEKNWSEFFFRLNFDERLTGQIFSINVSLAFEINYLQLAPFLTLLTFFNCPLKKKQQEN